jgi:aquaporin Z
MMINKYTAEILGTLILTLCVGLSFAGHMPVPTPVVAALALGACVYTLGPVSGGHFNPAITLGVLAIRKISTQDAVMYICSQLIGAAAAAVIIRYIAVIPYPEVPDGVFVMICELIGTVIFATGVAAATLGKTSQGSSGLTVGASLLLGILVATTGSHGVLNPAVALGIHSFSFSYLFGPIAGAILAMGLYKHITQ